MTHLIISNADLTNALKAVAAERKILGALRRVRPERRLGVLEAVEIRKRFGLR
jgi:hypothetical protein